MIYDRDLSREDWPGHHSRQRLQSHNPTHDNDSSHDRIRDTILYDSLFTGIMPRLTITPAWNPWDIPELRM